MGKLIEIPFNKFHGLGNDFIVVTGERLPRPLARLARAVSDRHTGIGADGVLVVLPARDESHDALARFLNPDGSEAEMSGNGIRCVAAFLVAQGNSKRQLQIETAAGVRLLRRVKSGRHKWIFRVDMGTPILEAAAIPFGSGDFPSPVVRFPLHTERGVLPVTVTSMGNPHCTVFIDDFRDVDWPSLGREIERHELFPQRTNVEFVKVISRTAIEVRFWERGAGETLSSGTGSCGAVVACVLNNLTDRKIWVHTRAGKLRVEWPEKSEVFLTGPVERIAQGAYYYG